MLCTSASYAKSGQAGRSYYDEEEKIVKEVYSVREVQKFNPRDKNPDVKVVFVKHGAYFKYYESGQLKKSGNYNNDKKDGEWTYYDEEGNIIRTVTYDKDVVVEKE